MGFWKSLGSFISGAAGGSLIGAGVSALGGLLGANKTNNANERMMREQMEWNTKEREASQSYNTRERVSSQDWQNQQRILQNAWARDMYEAYQTPQAIAAQFKAAGLNPRLAMGSNSVGNISASSGSSGGAPSGSHVSPLGVSVPYMSSQGYVSAFGDIANALKSLGEAKELGIKTEYTEEMLKEQIRGLKLSNESQEFLLSIDRKYLDKERAGQLANIMQDLENKSVSVSEARQRIENMKIDKQYKEKLLNSFDERFKNEMDELKSRIRVNDSTVKENEANAKRAIQEANQLILDNDIRGALKKLEIFRKSWEYLPDGIRDSYKYYDMFKTGLVIAQKIVEDAHGGEFKDAKDLLEWWKKVSSQFDEYPGYRPN